jgi:hypothetical protein
MVVPAIPEESLLPLSFKYFVWSGQCVVITYIQLYSKVMPVGCIINYISGIFGVLMRPHKQILAHSKPLEPLLFQQSLIRK